MTGEEKLGIYNYNIEKKRELDENERNLIGDIRAGLNRKYKIYVWALSGEISLTEFYENYNNIISKYEVFRTRILYRNIAKPIKITIQSERDIFPVTDLRKTTEDKHKILIDSIIAAESRKNFNPEEDAPMKIMGFITGSRSLVVIFKIYSHYSFPLSPFDLKGMIFSNMKTDFNSDYIYNEELNDKINDNIKHKCIEYWRETLSPVGHPVRIPFSTKNSSNSENQYTIIKEIDTDLYSSIVDFSKRASCEVPSVVIREFANFIGTYNEIQDPIMAVRVRNSLMQVMLVKVKTGGESLEVYKNIEEQYKGFELHNNCSFGDVYDGLGFPVKNFFDISFEFVEEDSEYKKIFAAMESIYANDVDHFFPRLEIKVNYSKESMIITYVYDSDVIDETGVNQIHDTVMHLLLERVQETIRFDWRKYVLDCMNEDEKLSRLAIAQKALYIKDGDFFHTDVPDEIISLSDKGHVGNYTVEDSIYEAGKVISSLGILVEGHIEERYVDLTGMVKTLSVYKPGYIIGIECAVEEVKGSFTYVAIDKNVKVMWIPGDVLRETLKNHVGSYEKLLKKSYLETTRVKKIWALD